MTENLAEHRQLERRLWMTRWMHEGQESAEEDAILDELEAVWWKLSDDERSILNEEGPRCWPTDPSLLPPELNGTPYSHGPAQWSYEGFRSASQAILAAGAT